MERLHSRIPGRPDITVNGQERLHARCIVTKRVRPPYPETPARGLKHRFQHGKSFRNAFRAVLPALPSPMETPMPPWTPFGPTFRARNTARSPHASAGTLVAYLRRRRRGKPCPRTRWHCGHRRICSKRTACTRAAPLRGILSKCRPRRRLRPHSPSPAVVRRRPADGYGHLPLYEICPFPNRTTPAFLPGRMGIP